VKEEKNSVFWNALIFHTSQVWCGLATGQIFFVSIHTHQPAPIPLVSAHSHILSGIHHIAAANTVWVTSMDGNVSLWTETVNKE
jgi:hypothetical protein